jgi:hypothetical protein
VNEGKFRSSGSRPELSFTGAVPRFPGCEADPASFLFLYHPLSGQQAQLAA